MVTDIILRCAVSTQTPASVHTGPIWYMEEAAIRNHILQLLLSHQKLCDYRADALAILFKLAGAAFEAYTDPSIVDHCFELLQDHKDCDPHGGSH